MPDDADGRVGFRLRWRDMLLVCQMLLMVCMMMMMNDDSDNDDFQS